MPSKTSLTNEEISRYSRQLMLPSIGVRGQEKIVKAKVLVVGAGGLGSPCIMYLAAAGVGTIGIVDYDILESSNLQRQVIHCEKNVGISKSHSAAEQVKLLNPLVNPVAHNILMDKSNALDLITTYDIVVDCTDNPTTRYLLNDACVLTKKPLVSGGALKMDGQLTVYNHKGGPCYRCLFPVPPDPSTVTNCSDGGILGAVTGIIGSAQALEVIKLICNDHSSFSQKMLIVDAETGNFRTIKLRGRQPNCEICGDDPKIKTLVDYVQFCGAAAHDKGQDINILPLNERVTCLNYYESFIKPKRNRHILLDVREAVQYDICALEESINIPFSEFRNKIDEFINNYNTMKDLEGGEVQVFTVCRRGNDSQLAVNMLKEKGIKAKDIIGGLNQWSKDIDTSFPSF